MTILSYACPFFFRLPRLAALLALLLTCLVLSGCGAMQFGPSSGGGSTGTKRYTIRGKTYYPLKSADGYWEEGVASWYGKQFHGRLTANGERYDMYGMTAAHKLLPFNTKVRVRNLRNNRTIIVRVNDRGPFVDDRVIDLTYTAAQRLDMVGAGTARVRVEALNSGGGQTRYASSSGSSAPRSSPTSQPLYIQLAAVREKVSADAVIRRLSEQNLGGRTFYAPNLRLWRVQAGPFYGSETDAALRRLQRLFPSSFIVK